MYTNLHLAVYYFLAQISHKEALNIDVKPKNETGHLN